MRPDKPASVSPAALLRLFNSKRTRSRVLEELKRGLPYPSNLISKSPLLILRQRRDGFAAHRFDEGRFNALSASIGRFLPCWSNRSIALPLRVIGFCYLSHGATAHVELSSTFSEKRGNDSPALLLGFFRSIQRCLAAFRSGLQNLELLQCR